MLQKGLYCQYYQAHVEKRTSWFVVAILKSYDHLVLVRTINVAISLFEFFVPSDKEADFLLIMQALQNDNLIDSLIKMPNRLQDSSQDV